MTDLRDDTRAGFAELYGYASTGLWSAPGRVNLIGEHTDYNLGFVLPFAIDLRTVVAVAPRTDGRMRVASSFAHEAVDIELAQLSPDQLEGWSAYPLGVAWALGRFGASLGTAHGFDLFIDSNVPVGAGLSSSAAIECAVAVALNELWELGLDRPTLAKVGQLAENEAVGAPTGIMDQSASLLGQPDCAVFLDCRSTDAEIIRLGLKAAELEILVIDTGQAHKHATNGYAQRRASCERGAELLEVDSLRDVDIEDLPRARALLDPVTFRRVRHVVTENQRVLDTVRALREEGPGDIGRFLDGSHRSMSSDFEISTAELDLAVETARANGALGARMTGGGFGGSAIALIPTQSRSLLQVAIDGAFAEHGYGQPDTFVVNAAAGATREP
jgi:galactokinase